MARAAPIGRENEFDALMACARAAAAGRGSIVFLAGPTGSGKSSLVKALADALDRSDEKPQPEVVSVLCYETGAGNPLGPFGEILRALTSRERRGDQAKRVIELVRQVAPPLVELIPVIGKLAALGVKAAADASVYALGPDHASQQAQLASDVTVALRKVATEIPLVVAIDDAHWIDAPSTEVIARLAHQVETDPLLVLLAYDGDLVDDRHPLARVRSAVLGGRGVRLIALHNFGLQALEAMLHDRYGDVPGENFAEWLLDRTDGSPLFLEQYLTTLEEQRTLRQADGQWILDGSIEPRDGDWRLRGALAQMQTPDKLLALLGPRVADLDDEERALLETGAVQGRRFLSAVVVSLLEREEQEILDRLDRLARRRRMIDVENAEDWWSDRSNLYAFDPGVLQELLYARYARSAYERRRRHVSVARALEDLIADDRPPPRHALLEIARHYEEAGDVLAAARRVVGVADSTFAEGADRETAAHAERAAELLRTALAGDLADDARLEAQRLLARAIILLLLGGEPRWRAGTAETDGELILALADEATRAADAVGDAALRANARYAAALVLIGYRGLHEGIAAFREALELSRTAADPVGEFAILVNLAHQLDSVSLKEGWDRLQEAQALLASGVLANKLDDATLAFETARLETRIGVAAFDLGNYGQALELLVRSSHALRMARRREEAAWAMSFLAQVYTAVGLYEAAEATLRDAIALFADESANLGVRGYLRALLGRAYLEWKPAQPAVAREELQRGRNETAASGYRAVALLVESYWAEYLLAEGSRPALDEADAMLAAGASFGWARSEIMAESLQARIALAEGRVDDAVRLSSRAVKQLRERGGAVPAVRSEEILLGHVHVLEAAGSNEAAVYAEEAARIVRAKAASLQEPAQRQSFLERVRLSVAVLAAAERKRPGASNA